MAKFHLMKKLNQNNSFANDEHDPRNYKFPKINQEEQHGKDIKRNFNEIKI